MTALELAVRFGKTLIIQEVDGVEPILYPVLRKDFTSQGPRFVVQIGEKGVDYNENFRLVMDIGFKKKLQKGLLFTYYYYCTISCFVKRFRCWEVRYLANGKAKFLFSLGYFFSS